MTEGQRLLTSNLIQGRRAGEGFELDEGGVVVWKWMDSSIWILKPRLLEEEISGVFFTYGYDTGYGLRGKYIHTLLYDKAIGDGDLNDITKKKRNLGRRAMLSPRRKVKPMLCYGPW